MRQLIAIFIGVIGAFFLSGSVALADSVKGPSTERGRDAARDEVVRAVDPDEDDEDVDCDVANGDKKVAANDDDDEDDNAAKDDDDDDSGAKDDDDDGGDDEDEADKKAKTKDGPKDGGR